MIVLFVAAAVAYGLILRLPHRGLITPALVAAGVHPSLGVVCAATQFGLLRGRQIRSLRSKAARHRADELLAIDLVASGVEAGVSFATAVATAVGCVNDAVASDLSKHLKRANRGALTDPEADSTPVDSMFEIARSSATSGASLGTELRGLSDAERERDDVRQEERLARLPVKMLFPLSFLILPGFLLVAVVPAVVDGISKLTL
ncbi:MAG: hypothetical protein DWP92_03695 [Armatimonadetes bacterium]|nr:MAG: hypothetical protein DWP92_03695 [Armatimonadota bacterium]